MSSACSILAAKGAALIGVLLIVGILFAVLLADGFGRIKLQIIGFIGCAAGLLLASFPLPDFIRALSENQIDSIQ